MWPSCDALLQLSRWGHTDGANHIQRVAEAGKAWHDERYQPEAIAGYMRGLLNQYSRLQRYKAAGERATRKEGERWIFVGRSK